MKISLPKWMIKTAIQHKHNQIIKLNKELQPTYDKILSELIPLIGEKEDEEQYYTIAILCLGIIAGFTEHKDRKNTIELLSKMEQDL